jgi:hypothetical protein
MTPRAIRQVALITAGVAAAALIACAVLAPKLAAAGWLVGFAFWSQILVGCLTLTMIHRLTAGRWGEIIAPVVEPSAAVVSLLLILAVPVFIAIPSLYPWPHGATAIKPDVLAYYLNAPWFIGRALLALLGWAALAFFLPRTTGGRGQLLAALGLVFHAIVISSVAIDWYLSLEAPFTSSSFGASVAISSLVAALAWAAALAPADDPAVGDVGALLLATILGITYIDFMAVLVIWYGDLPREVSWFVARQPLPWMILAWAAFTLVGLFPILALIQARIRNGRTPLRFVGVCVLVGLVAYDAYLVAPPFGAMALAPALLAIIGIGAALAAILAGNARPFSSQEPARAR